MTIALALLSVAFAVLACPDEGHDHALHKRAQPSVPLAPPSRPLVWGDINFIHTTDSHGWLLGHQKPSLPEPNYSGDLGDFFSFVDHMKEIAKKKDVDLLLIDSGDLHDGTGLTDAFPPGGVDGHDANQFYAQLPYDVLAIGNHELYVYADAYDIYTNFAPNFNGRYLSSNVNITVFDKHNSVVSVPVGSRFAKFKTKKGRKVTALGVLYNFSGNDKNTTVQKVADMVKETWFIDAIQEEPDFFLLVGHMPVQRDNWPLVFNAVRAVHPTTPILIFGGHTHIRDCVQLDGRSMSLESGRYMETVGWLSANLDQKGSIGNITFNRRYLDPNRVTYEYHTSTQNDHQFDTSHGQKITSGLIQLASRFNINFKFGTAPQDYYLSRASYPSNQSSLTLFINEAIPLALATNNTRASIPNIFITNSGSQRFDIYSGTFTVNDQLTASPFTDAFLFIPGIPASVASQVLKSLNGAGANGRRGLAETETELYARGYVDLRYGEWLEEMDKRDGMKRAAANLTLGYVTTDSCPGVGDDILHAPLPFFSSPDFIASDLPNVSGDTNIDLVFVGFIEAQLLRTLNRAQTTKNYTSADVQTYSPILSNEALGIFAQAKWN